MGTFSLLNPPSRSPSHSCNSQKKHFVAITGKNTLFYKAFVLQLCDYLIGLSSESLKTHQFNNLKH